MDLKDLFTHNRYLITKEKPSYSTGDTQLIIKPYYTNRCRQYRTQKNKIIMLVQFYKILELLIEATNEIKFF